MIIDGKQIAGELFDDVKRKLETVTHVPRLSVLTSAPNFETQKFLAVKKKKADALGISMNVIELDPSLDTDECVQTIRKAAAGSDGIVVQLPFPSHIDHEALIKSIPKTHDVDAFNLKDANILPPVVGAIAEIVKQCGITLENAQCVVVGDGKLVGAPAAVWLEKTGAKVAQLTKENGDIAGETKKADIIVLGAGVPGLLKPDMVKAGVAIFDAGTSETEGRLVGDADPKCAEKASVFTPVPGGIGPITVAVLLRNLVLLAERHDYKNGRKRKSASGHLDG